MEKEKRSKGGWVLKDKIDIPIRGCSCLGGGEGRKKES